MVECPNCKAELEHWNNGNMYECLICGDCFQEEYLDEIRGVNNVQENR